MMNKLIILLMILVNFFMRIPLVNSDTAQLAPALYVFGDSLFDSGNNNLLPTLAKADFLPYGANFATGATGRFTNGRTVVDFIAEFLGLPYSPPYLSQRGQGTLTGLNYASGSCGILPESGNYIGKCLHLAEQINLFQTTVEKELPRRNESFGELSKYLSKSIFVISTGSNDYINNYLQPRIYDSNRRFSPQSFAQLLIGNLSQQLQRLYGLGARKIVVFEIGPIGCIPSISKQEEQNGRCVNEINQMATLFNIQLSAALKSLTSTLKDSAFVLGHAHWLGYDALVHPTNYGLTDSSKPCCITWANGTSGCIPHLLPCVDADKHYFWDGFHLTESLYRTIAARCFNDTSVCIPKNIKELVQSG